MLLLASGDAVFEALATTGISTAGLGTLNPKPPKPQNARASPECKGL